MVAEKATLQIAHCARVAYSRIAYRIRTANSVIAYRISHSRGPWRIRGRASEAADPLFTVLSMDQTSPWQHMRDGSPLFNFLEMIFIFKLPII